MQGVFKKDRTDIDYYFWSLRAVIKKWPIWIADIIPSSFMDNLILKVFNVKTNFSNNISDGTIDTEFIEFGKNVIIGKGSSIKSSFLFKGNLIIKKIKIGDNVVIGSYSFIGPGTQIGDDTILGAMSVTKFNQRLEPNSMYYGDPLEKRGENQIDSTEISHEMIFKNFTSEFNKPASRNLDIDKKSVDKFVKNIPFNIFIFLIIYSFSNLIPLLTIIYFFNEYFLPQFLQTILITPLFLIFLYLVNLVVVTLISKVTYKMLQFKNSAKEGIFDWKDKNIDFKNYFKRSFILRYVKWKMQKSPFPWLIKPAFNFIGNCHFGRNTIVENSYIAKEFLEVGENSYLGKALIANHLWDKNLTVKGIKIGENVEISDNCCIAPGTEIDKDVTLMPLSVTSKCDKLTSNSVYSQSPLKKISDEEFNQKLNQNLEPTSNFKKKRRIMSKTLIINNMITTNNFLMRNKNYWVYFILIWLSIFPTSLFFVFFFNLFSTWIPSIVVICLLPSYFILYYAAFILHLLFFTKLFLIIINLIYKPKEGIFDVTLKNKDLSFLLLRRNLISFVLKIYNYFPLPWAKILALKILNIKISYNTGALDSYIDSEFIEIGNNVILGEGSIIMSSMIVGDFLLVKRIILRDECTIGAFSVISPGTVVEEGAILGMGSYTKVNQYLEKNSVNVGRPAKKI